MRCDMAIHRIGDEEFEDSGKPWINEYLDEEGQPGDMSPVLSLKATLKGMLVLCQDFKGFLFKGSSSYEQILAAIPVWKEQKDLPFQIVGIAQSNGKIGMAIDDEFTCVAIVNKKGSVDFKSPTGTSGQDQQNGNPFLKGLIIPPTTESRAGVESSTPTRRTKKPF